MHNSMHNETTYPLLPSIALDATLDFYRALGFEVVFEQREPYLYAEVRRGGIDLHFFHKKGLSAPDSYAGCVVATKDAAAIRAAFAAGLQAHYGVLPVAGLPRLTPLRNSVWGTRVFNLVDPGGNWLRFNQWLADPDLALFAAEEHRLLPPSALSHALTLGELMMDIKGNCTGAARVLDRALASDEPAPPRHRVAALILRAVVGMTRNENALAASLLAQVRQIPLTTDDRVALQNDLERATHLEAMLAHASNQ